MGTLCSKQLSQDAEISKRIAKETKLESHVEKLLLLGAGESGKSTIFKQIRVLFHTQFDESELKNYIPVIHANTYQSIKILHDASKEFAETEKESPSQYVMQPENQEIGEKIFESGSSSEFPTLTSELALDIEHLWKDPAIQVTFLRANELQLPDCTQYFLNNVARVAQPNYIPTQEDVLHARVRTTGIVEMEFRPIGVSNRKEVYKLLDVGGQRNERRKWIHLFDGVTAVIFCAALSEYDQTLFEDEKKNRMMETKELFDGILKEPGFEKTSFLLFLNKYDIFEEKAQRVPLNVCEWFRDYMPSTTGQHDIDHAYEFVKKKFEEIYNQNNSPNSVERVFQIYKTTALDQTIVKKTFGLVDKALTLKRLQEAELL